MEALLVHELFNVSTQLSRTLYANTTVMYTCVHVRGWILEIQGEVYAPGILIDRGGGRERVLCMS